jgi:DNA helicase IV
MKAFRKFLLWIGLFITGVWLYRQYEENQRKKKELEEAKRKQVQDYFKSKLFSLEQAVREFESNINLYKGYFSYSQLTYWKNRYGQLFADLQSQEFAGIIEVSQLRRVNTFKNYFNNSEYHRQKFNTEFIPHELKLNEELFDNIEGRKLDVQQRTSIVTDEDNNIVIAGAGSGKTTTIVGKVNYVVNRYKTNPEDVLLISFTNKSASTLSSRLKIDGADVKTFHKFGKDVIAEVEKKQPSIYDENQFRPFITSTFNTLITDENYLWKVTEYFTDFVKPEKSQFDFEKQGDYIQFLKDQNFRPYLQIQPNGRQTLHREIVKSIEECKIANFLLFHGLTYKYEFPYEYDTATPLHSRWRPDFTVTQNGKTVYIEHFAVKRNGDVPPFFAKDGESYQAAKDKYWKKIDWAREQTKNDATILIETYSYEMFEGILYDNLKVNLEKHGIIVKLRPPSEIWRIVVDAAKEEVASFITLFQTFISLMKSNNYTISDVKSKNSHVTEGFQKKRNDRFIEMVTPIFNNYEAHLIHRGEIDFSDMINKACYYIKTREYKKEFSYIIVDEFQDISIGRYQLLSAIKEVNPSCKLFCVGDDWQSIYRFSGSDISLFKDFEKYFGYSAKSKIETTYRFHNPLLKLSSDFIQKNPNQERKELKSTSLSRSTAYEIKYSTSEPQNPDDTEALQSLLDELVQLESNIDSKSIYMLGRYNHDIQRIRNTARIFTIDLQAETPRIVYKTRSKDSRVINLAVDFFTIHKAKGLEADIVILINCNSGKYGFPSEMSDDQILNLLLSEADQFENGEERRLFYVAMTRAKERIYFITDTAFKSKFIQELEVDLQKKEIKKCPTCLTADLVKRTGTTNGRQWAFWSCTNSLYGCDYKDWVK